MTREAHDPTLEVSESPSSNVAEPDLRVSSRKDVAAGLPALAATARYVRSAPGVGRGARALLRVNQVAGFDCPGCAWPEPSDRSRFEFCENGAKAVADETTRDTISRRFFAEHTIDKLAAQTDYWLGKQGRLIEPVIKRPGQDHYEPIEWEDAYRIIGDELRALATPNEAVFYTSGRTSNEAAFLYQLFARRFGTNNLPDCSNMCHESSGAALSETIGIGKGTVTLDDLHAADLIFVVGQNPGTNHPRMLTALERAKRSGARIIAVNPLPEAGLIRFKNPQRPRGLIGAGTALADQFLQIRVNGDLALFQALNRLLLEEEELHPGEVLDREFIEQSCDGFDEFVRHVGALSWDNVERATGIPKADIDATLRMVLESKRIIICWAMGLTQHRNSVATIQEIVNFALLRGNVGKPGAGLCPVRGHSNVQGDRTMGVYEKPSKEFLESLEREFSFAPPRAHGLDTIESIYAMAEGCAKVFVGLGGNFAAATPDANATWAALRRCRLTVHVSTKLNRSHVVCGDTALILPCLARSDLDLQASGPQQVTVEDSMGEVHASTGRLAPVSSSLRSEIAIVCGVARHTLDPEPAIDWHAFSNDYSVVRNHIARVIPGFKDFNERLQASGGFTLPNGPRDAREFATTTSHARFTVNALDVLEIPEGRLLLQTLRSHDQYNTTIYGLDDRYRGITNGRRVVFVHERDLENLGWRDGDVVDLVNDQGGTERRASRFRVVAYSVAQGTCAAYFPEANVLVPLDSTADTSNTPTSKSIIVHLVPPA